jgi:hypothetical protein
MKHLILLLFLEPLLMGAQSVPIQTLLNRQARSGVTTSNTFNVPLVVTGQAYVLLDVAPADLTDPAKGAMIELLVFNGAEFKVSARAVYVGHVPKKPGGTPGFMVNVAEYAGKQVQGRISVKTCVTSAASIKGVIACNGAETAGTMQVGATIEVR